MYGVANRIIYGDGLFDEDIVGCHLLQAIS
jgi:hypothetical protein